MHTCSYIDGYIGSDIDIVARMYLKTIVVSICACILQILVTSGSPALDGSAGIDSNSWCSP